MRLRILVVLIPFALLLALSYAWAAHAQTEPPEPVFDCDFINSGGPGDNSFTGTNLNDCWSGLGGKDAAVGFGGHDRLDLGSDDDQACGGDCSGGGTDVQDVLRGGTGQDLLIGDGGNDYIYFGDGTGDEGRGGNGDDTLAACDNNPDFVKGGNGFNTCWLDRQKDVGSFISGCDVKHYC